MSKSRWVNMSPRVRSVAREALVDGLEFIKDEANKRVPHDEGTLEASGSYQVNGSKAEGVVFYDTPYAVRLHEHPEYHFQKGRQGKWLENTINECGPQVMEYIQSKINSALG